jgi:acyl-CoA reductase-like NAD-dependent aldehyde dehydrogenase
MKHEAFLNPDDKKAYDEALGVLDAAKDGWARISNRERIAILEQIKTALMEQAEGWVETAARRKHLPADSPLAGEEWFSGPYAVMTACNGLILTLSQMDGKTFLAQLPHRRLGNSQLAVRVVPYGLHDRLLLSGVKAEVWMQPGVTETTLQAASAYDVPPDERRGKVALVLGAGNIAAIAPLDAIHKLFVENEVVLLKLNPLNDYLLDYLKAALKPLIDRNALRIVLGDGAAGAYLVEHPLVRAVHLTGAEATHNAIVWGSGPEGDRNREAGTPRNDREFTSELGAVCPTIVVPGPWSKADIRFQAEQLATQKLHNSGHNCVALQTLILPQGWDKADALMRELRVIMAGSGQRVAYYPGSERRSADFAEHGGVDKIDRGSQSPSCLLADMDKGDMDWLSRNEVFAPALAIKRLPAKTTEEYLCDAIAFSNNKLYGTLGANIVIHPRTIKEVGRDRFEALLTELHYGAIAINAWSALAFLLNACPWGGFPGADLRNTFMLEKTERTIVEAPWRPFPRNLLSLRFSLLPRPPWFITNRRQHVLGRLLTGFQFEPSLMKLPRIFINALRG